MLMRRLAYASVAAALVGSAAGFQSQKPATGKQFRLSYEMRGPKKSQFCVTLLNGTDRGVWAYPVGSATLKMVIVSGSRSRLQIQDLVSGASIPLLKSGGSIQGVLAATFFSRRLQVGTHRLRLVYSDGNVNQVAKDHKWKWKSQVGSVTGPLITIRITPKHLVRVNFDDSR